MSGSFPGIYRLHLCIPQLNISAPWTEKTLQRPQTSFPVSFLGRTACQGTSVKALDMYLFKKKTKKPVCDPEAQLKPSIWVARAAAWLVLASKLETERSHFLSRLAADIKKKRRPCCEPTTSAHLLYSLPFRDACCHTDARVD